jgi:hypothetical protein
MDDLTFRKRIYANPHDNAQDIIDACNDDKAKVKFKCEMKKFDAKLNSAFNVKVPDNLAERILLSQSMDTQKSPKKRTKVYLALAASVVFCVGLVSTRIGLINNFDTVGEYALAHNAAEIVHSHDDNHYSLQQLNTKLSGYGAQFINAFPKVSFAGTCYFGRIKSLHMVIQGDKYPVTIFLIPKESGLEQTPYFSDQNYNGESIEVNDNQLLIITHKDDPNKSWAKELSQSFQWTTL